LDKEQRPKEDDIGNNYLQRREMLHELNSPAMDLLKKYAPGTDVRKPEPQKPISEKTVASEGKEVKAAGIEYTGAPDLPIEADPWIDPLTAFLGGATGMGKTAIARGVKLVPALGRALVSGTVGAVADVPLGAGAEKVAEKYPVLAFPFALTIGMISGMTVENAIEKSVIKALGKKASSKLIKETVETVTGNLKTGKIEDDITASVVEDLNEAAKVGKAAPPTIEGKAGVKGEVAKPLESLGDSTKPLVEIMEDAGPKAKLFLETDIKDLPKRAININFARIESADDIKEALAKTAKIYEPDIQAARRGTVSNVNTQRLANLLNLTPEQLLTRRKGQAFNAQEALSARRILISSGETLVEMAHRISAGEATDIDKFNFQKMFATHYAIQAQVSGMTAEAGRALQSFKIMAKSTEGKLKQMQAFLEQAGKGTATPEELAEMVSKLDTAEGLNRFVKDAHKATTFDMVMEAWINGLLSGPQTHAVNTLSNSLVALWQIPERTLAAGLSKAMPGNQEIFAGEALNQAYGLIEGFKDGLKAFGKTIISGEPTDALTKLEANRFRAITGANVGFDEGGIAATAVDLLGEGVRMPGRFLMAEDEFFKGIGYRMELRARAFRQAKMEGLQGEDMARRMQEIINDPPDDIQLDAINTSHYQTFTKELGPAGKSFQKILSTLPALRFIVPFVRTPTNIVKFFGERTPLAFVSKNVRTEIAAGGARRDLALAKMSLGSMVMATTATLAAEGVITGGGPSDANMRNIKRNTGWQPYSIKIDGKYYSYSRLEPLGMVLGTAADITEIIGQLTAEDADKLAAYAVMAFSKNITSKTWLRGISETLNVMDDPDRYGKRYIERFAGSAVPTGVAQVERLVDPEVRAVYNIMDEMKSRIPGYSSELFPRRNLWGDPIVLEGGMGPDIVSPIYTSEAKESPVDEELLKLKAPIGMPSKTQNIHGVSFELTPKEYDRLVVEMNTITLPQTGKNLKDSLDYLVTRDPTYKNLSDDRKEQMIRAYITQAREMARQELYDKMPDIRWLVEKLQAEKIQAQ
jgi:hypothetical protein